MRTGSRTAATAVAAGLLLGLGQPVASAENIGQQGCTPGYWKNHTGAWQEYAPTTKVRDAFRLSALLSGDRQAMPDLAAKLDAANNLGCPL